MKPALAPSTDTLIRPSYECSACGAIHVSPRGLPVGWSQNTLPGAIWCAECTDAGIPARELQASRRKAA